MSMCYLMKNVFIDRGFQFSVMLASSHIVLLYFKNRETASLDDKIQLKT